MSVSIKQKLERLNNRLTKELDLPFYFLLSNAIVFIIFSFSVASFSEIMQGLFQIIIQPDTLITDYIVIGGMGGAFFNAGLVALTFLYLIYYYKSKVSGLSFAAIFLLIGFSFLGKNILNIWSIILGVYLYTKYHNQKFSSYLYIAMFATAMSPIITEIILFVGASLIVRLIVGNLVGVFLGFIVPPLATHLLRTHQGYNLYNVGFAAGLILSVTVGILKSFGFNTNPQLIWGTAYNEILSIFLYALFSGFILLAFLCSKDVIKHYRRLLTHSGRLVTDFLAMDHRSAVFFNMGINGLLSTTFVLAIGSNLNGATMAGIFTIVGFSAFGKHVRNMYPIVIGIIIATMIKGDSLQTPSIILATLFGTGLAPIAGQYGALWGIVAGFLHLSVVTHVSILHGGLNLYSNGFACGLVAAVLIPIIQSLKKEV